MQHYHLHKHFHDELIRLSVDNKSLNLQLQSVECTQGCFPLVLFSSSNSLLCSEACSSQISNFMSDRKESVDLKNMFYTKRINIIIFNVPASCWYISCLISLKKNSTTDSKKSLIWSSPTISILSKFKADYLLLVCLFVCVTLSSTWEISQQCVYYICFQLPQHNLHDEHPQPKSPLFRDILSSLETDCYRCTRYSHLHCPALTALLTLDK